MSDAQTAWDMEQLAEALEHRGQHESEGRWSIDVDINVELPLIIAALKRSDGPNGRAVAWVASTTRGSLLHLSEIDGWKVEAVLFEPSPCATGNG